MASKRQRMKKKHVIELSPNQEEVAELDMKVGVLGPLYGGSQCNMDVCATYKWCGLY